ncbi:transcriptional regulator CtsR [Caldanaerovirga acetigignens]|uniref:Transcriptional regulator CtsR n=1 Tax=Caldanaerovirga acetigignens TaxID=447595 RepID=A0A1M7KZJ6_9FIRM|nr:CtsR family transcriptional regulator [Caldanaerovirga acetigignens]SHM71125.1 transcriptional regulator CtsR [Caldanaerovirga acetigignens]
MPNLADVIENFIKEMFQEGKNILEIQRNELASKFRCAPSQINYVLTTRFTVERGYIVESRRGGGGYIRIKKLKIRNDEFLRELIELVGDSISSSKAGGLVQFMLEEGIISKREAELFWAAINRKNLEIPLPERDRLRARLLKAMIAALLGHEEEKGD